MPFLRSTFFTLSLLFFAFTLSSASRCYYCESREQCKHPIKQQCPNGVTHCAVITIGVDPYEGKECAYDDEDKEEIDFEGCVERDHPQYGKVKMCVCKGDLCNSGDNSGDNAGSGVESVSQTFVTLISFVMMLFGVNVIN